MKAQQMADGIRAVIAGLQIMADALEQPQTETPPAADPKADEPPPTAKEEKPPKETQPKEPPAVTETDVRKLLAGKAKEGFTAEVKELLAKYGTSMISKLDPKHYAAVIEEAEGIQ